MCLEVFHQDLALLQSRLMLPESLHGSQAAKDAGLTGEAVQLLPSFLHFLRCSAESWSEILRLAVSVATASDYLVTSDL